MIGIISFAVAQIIYILSFGFEQRQVSFIAIQPRRPQERTGGSNLLAVPRTYPGRYMVDWIDPISHRSLLKAVWPYKVELQNIRSLRTADRTMMNPFGRVLMNVTSFKCLFTEKIENTQLKYFSIKSFHHILFRLPKSCHDSYSGLEYRSLNVGF